MYRLRVAKYQKEQTKLSNYSIMSLRENLSQTLNVRNLNNNEDDGLYKTIMFETTSTFFQEEDICCKKRVKDYVQEEAKSKLSAVYFDISDPVWVICQKIENKQKKNQILKKFQKSTSHNNQQYKLNTGSIVDLLNFEQSIHMVAKKIENFRYFIFFNCLNFIKKLAVHGV
ncbi:hypothetical protein [Acinetobacter calcoaceticus]|uniref:hypothetical protein n=1 Tax=Acinetobacter calcoaceticus TaxID=471 RepID=UPI003A89F9B4